MSDTSVLQEKEQQITPILSNLQEKNPEAINRFFEIFSDEIYSYPLRYYNFSEDEAGDFYLYAFEHLNDGRKFTSFKKKSRFTTWLFSVLRNLVIDFLRSRRHKIRTTTFARTDSNGNIIDGLDYIADTDETLSVEDEIFENFKKHLSELKMAHRVLFKLAYIYYMDITEEEVDWICETAALQKEEVHRRLFDLKEIGREKASEVRKVEDKLTANYQAMTMLENRIEHYFMEHPTIKTGRNEWSEDFSSPEIDLEVLEWIRAFSKKRAKQLRLLKSQKKSLLMTRVPYKDIVPLMNTSEGVLSVQLIRIIEKLAKTFDSITRESSSSA